MFPEVKLAKIIMELPLMDMHAASSINYSRPRSSIATGWLSAGNCMHQISNMLLTFQSSWSKISSLTRGVILRWGVTSLRSDPANTIHSFRWTIRPNCTLTPDLIVLHRGSLSLRVSFIIISRSTKKHEHVTFSQHISSTGWVSIACSFIKHHGWAKQDIFRIKVWVPVFLTLKTTQN